MALHNVATDKNVAIKKHIFVTYKLRTCLECHTDGKVKNLSKAAIHHTNIVNDGVSPAPQKELGKPLLTFRSVPIFLSTHKFRKWTATPCAVGKSLWHWSLLGWGEILVG